MLSSRGAKTKLLKTPGQGGVIRGPEVSSLFKAEPSRVKPITNVLSLRISQPGLPSWWRLAAPQLNWVSSFTRHLAWATLVLNPQPLLLGKDNDIRVDWLTPRARLATLTRGPMARKKKSRIQLNLVRKPLQLRLKSHVTEGLGLCPRRLEAGLGAMLAEESFWASSLPSPMTLAKSKLVVSTVGPYFLLWH